jgi:NAD(P)-dependent dehydrogenase (short-subunit alcohol dehydrogenase family)
MSRMQNKVAVITGGNSGIGLATAKAFVKEGAKVALLGRDSETLDAAVAELGDAALGIRGDVTSPDDLDRLFSTVEQQLGSVSSQQKSDTLGV